MQQQNKTILSTFPPIGTAVNIPYNNTMSITYSSFDNRNEKERIIDNNVRQDKRYSKLVTRLTENQKQQRETQNKIAELRRRDATLLSLTNYTTASRQEWHLVRKQKSLKYDGELLSARKNKLYNQLYMKFLDILDKSGMLDNERVMKF